MRNTFYITTAIDYVNDTIHIGHAFQKVAADVLARYYRIKLGKGNVFFLTGTDEYGQNIAKAAEKNGLTPQEWADKIAQTDKKEQDCLNISYERFIRTTDKDHEKVAKEIWKRVNASGDIYLSTFTGLYCTSCETYYAEDDLVNGKCPYHPTVEIKSITEENYFFRWSKYQDFLIEHIQNHPEFVQPESRRNEMLEFARRGIKDIPISRTSFTWGVPVPEDPKHVMYVWFDALTNYLTGVGFLENPKLFEKFWPADVHLLGKDNVQKHTLLWPAMLKSAGLALPKTVYGHGFLKLQGQKISKTLGNFVRASDWVKKYGADAVRYYLIRYTSLEDDGDISEEKLKQAYNSDLADELGNLLSRLTKLCEQCDIEREDTQPHVPASLETAGYSIHIENFQLNLALEEIWREIKTINFWINEKKPWSAPKDETIVNLHDWLQQLRNITVALEPFLPETAQKIRKATTGKITASQPLFPKS